MHSVKALIGIAALACSALAFSQDYPTRPITIVVPVPAGIGTDVLARVMAEEMSKNLKQPVIVDNKPGASGMLGASFVARSQPDGYTLLLAHATPIYYVQHLTLKMSYDVKRDFAFLTELCSVNQILAVGKDVPVHNMKEFIAWAQAHKGKVNYGSFGIGSSVHLTMSYLDKTRELGMTHVPYKGDVQMIQEMVGGQIQAGIGTLGSMGSLIASGDLRPLAIIGNSRLPELPDVPTMAEAGFTDKEFKQPFGGLVLLAPAKTPAPVLALLEKEARADVQTPAMKARFQSYGFVPVGNTSAEFRKNFDASGPIIQRLVEVSGAKPE